MYNKMYNNSQQYEHCSIIIQSLCSDQQVSVLQEMIQGPKMIPFIALPVLLQDCIIIFTQAMERGKESRKEANYILKSLGPAMVHMISIHTLLTRSCHIVTPNLEMYSSYEQSKKRKVIWGKLNSRCHNQLTMKRSNNWLDQFKNFSEVENNTNI